LSCRIVRSLNNDIYFWDDAGHKYYYDGTYRASGKHDDNDLVQEAPCPTPRK